MRRTPTGWTVRRGDETNHPTPAGDWPHGDDCADRWYADRDGEPIDHGGPGSRTRGEAIDALRDKLEDMQRDIYIIRN